MKTIYENDEDLQDTFDKYKFTFPEEPEDVKGFVNWIILYKIIRFN